MLTLAGGKLSSGKWEEQYEAPALEGVACQV